MIMRESNDEQILEKVVYALSQHESSRAMSAVRELVTRTDVSRGVRRQAIYWLGTEGSAADVSTLRALYSQLDDREMRKQIIFVVAEAGGQENRDWLLALATNEDEELELRKNAMYWIGESGASVAQLIRLYDQMHDREMRETLIWVLAENGDNMAIDKLLDIARNDSSVELREKAIFWLGESEDPRAIDFLIELIDG